jgi:hypothetical protein
VNVVVTHCCDHKKRVEGKSIIIQNALLYKNLNKITKIGKAYYRHKNLSKDNKIYPYYMIIDVAKCTSMIPPLHAIISSCINM